MKAFILALLTFASLNTFASDWFTFTHNLNTPGFCKNGQSVGELPMNCTRTLKINFEAKKAVVRLDDMMLPVSVRFEFLTVIVDLGEAYGGKEMVLDFDNQQNLIDQEGNVWYLTKK